MGAENIENLCWLWERNGMRSHLWFIYPVSMRNKKPLGIKGDTPMMPDQAVLLWDAIQKGGMWWGKEAFYKQKEAWIHRKRHGVLEPQEAR